MKGGFIESFFSGVAKIKGLSSVFLHEVLLDSSKKPVALVIGFDEDFVEALFFDEDFDLDEPVFRSLEVFSVFVSDKNTGRVFDGLGNPIDGLGKVIGDKTPVFNKAPSIMDRQPVSIPLSTGIKIIDTNLPLGRGQRELVIGDRKLGKSTIAADIILNQKYSNPPMHCIYVICGQKEQKVNELISVLERDNAFLYTTVIVASAGSSFAEQYLAPFIGCTMGEYFRDKGEDALVIYDDLSKHAKAYRDVSLLLKRVPGREAYPGDIFSLHAGLLERASRLSASKGGGSLSALPIIETEEGDITSFISTNIISITDGQIYLERGLFQNRFLPAINIGLSVSRVGSKVQPKLLRDTVENVRLDLSQYKELQKLAQLETAVSPETKEKIIKGGLLLELLKQEKHTNIKWAEQVILFYIIKNNYFNNVEREKWTEYEYFLLKLIRGKYLKVVKRIEKGVFDKGVENSIQEIVIDFKKEFLVKKDF